MSTSLLTEEEKAAKYERYMQKQREASKRHYEKYFKNTESLSDYDRLKVEERKKKNREASKRQYERKKLRYQALRLIATEGMLPMSEFIQFLI